MSREFDDIRKKIDQSYRELNRQDTDISKSIISLTKDNDKLIKEISDIKKQVKDINTKIDIMLEILNNFTIMLEEDDEDLEENYEFDSDIDQTWVIREDALWEDDETQE
jgi:chromosome segregation ATPase